MPRLCIYDLYLFATRSKGIVCCSGHRPSLVYFSQYLSRRCVEVLARLRVCARTWRGCGRRSVPESRLGGGGAAYTALGCDAELYEHSLDERESWQLSFRDYQISIGAEVRPFCSPDRRVVAPPALLGRVPHWLFSAARRSPHRGTLGTIE